MSGPKGTHQKPKAAGVEGEKKRVRLNRRRANKVVATRVMQQSDRTAQVSALQAAIRQMLQAQEALRDVFPKKLFTPDGRMIGDIGEAIAEICYQMTIDPGMPRHWDGKREKIGA